MFLVYLDVFLKHLARPIFSRAYDLFVDFKQVQLKTTCQIWQLQNLHLLCFLFSLYLLILFLFELQHAPK